MSDKPSQNSNSESAARKPTDELGTCEHGGPNFHHEKLPECRNWERVDATKEEHDFHEQFARLVYSFEPTEDGIAEQVAACAVDNFPKFARAFAEHDTREQCAYWKSRAETAELKVLTFNEEIAKLRAAEEVR